MLSRRIGKLMASNAHLSYERQADYAIVNGLSFGYSVQAT